MFKKNVLLLAVLGIVSCANQAPVDSYAKGNKEAYDCAVQLRGAVILWKANHAEVSTYPSITTLFDDASKEKYDLAACTQNGILSQFISETEFLYYTSSAFGSKRYKIDAAGITEEKLDMNSKKFGEE